MDTLAFWLALSAGNFIYQFIAQDGSMLIAFERSFFQGTALAGASLVHWLNR